MSAHLKQAGEPQQGLKKAHDAYARSNDRASAAARQELAEVLSALAEGLDELSTPLRQEAHELIEDNLTALDPSVAWRLRARICQDAGQARACDTVAALHDLRRSNPPLETQKAVRDEVRTLLKDSHAWPPALRAGMADALAQAFLGRLALSADFSELRSWLVDDAVRRHDDARRRPPTVFRKSEQVVDLGKIDPPDDGVQSGDAKSYTRNALKLTIDDILYRVKDIKYGNVRAAEEVLMTRLLALTGIDCPNVKLAMNGDHLFSFTDKSRNDYRHHKDDPARFAVVASEMVPDFVDLGELVVDEGKMLPMLTKLHGEDGAARYREALENYQKAHDLDAKFAEDEKLGVLQPSTEKEKEALTLEKRKVRSEKFEAMKTIYAMLPESLKQDTMKAHYMSRLIKDWDFLNYNWRNFGFRCPGEDPQTWRPVAMDEGNAGTAGFGGQQAHNSFERANVRAVEDDPEAPNQILRSEAVFDGNVGASRSGAATVARHRPSLPLIEEVIQSEIRMAEDGMYRQGLPAHEKKAFAGMLEAAYQMSFIPDEAFLRIAKESWPYDDDDFPPAEKDAAKLAVEKYAEILRERRDALVGKFSKADLAEWASQNPQRARTAYNDVSAAVAGMTGLHVEPPSQAGMAATI